MLDSVRKLKEQLKKTVEERIQELEYPTPIEVGMKIPGSEPHILVRDDGVVELAGTAQTGLRVDSANASIALQGRAISLTAQDLHLHAPPGGLWFGFQRFDPAGWWKSDNPGLSLNTVWNGPLVLNSAASLAGLREPLVAGLPNTAEGQYNVTLAETMHSQPLLGPDETFTIIASNIMFLLAALKS